MEKEGRKREVENEKASKKKKLSLLSFLGICSFSHTLFFFASPYALLPLPYTASSSSRNS